MYQSSSSQNLTSVPSINIVMVSFYLMVKQFMTSYFSFVSTILSSYGFHFFIYSLYKKSIILQGVRCGLLRQTIALKPFTCFLSISYLRSLTIIAHSKCFLSTMICQRFSLGSSSFQNVKRIFFALLSVVIKTIYFYFLIKCTVGLQSTQASLSLSEQN